MWFRSIGLMMSGLALAACSRPMTDGEITYGSQYFTQNLAFEDVRFSGNEARGRRVAKQQLERELGTAAGSASENSQKIASLPSLFGADALVVGNTVFFDREYYSSDISQSPINSDRWLMAHELTHVWQYQNRDMTGYSFAKVVSEHVRFGDDVYDYTLVNGKRFTDYRFEQQGKIVECYAMLKEVSPNGANTRKHEKLIRAEFPLDALMARIGMSAGDVIRVRESVQMQKCDGQ